MSIFLEINATYWTSGSTSVNCSHRFAWCGFDEIVDFEGLHSQTFVSTTGKDCLALSTQPGGQVELLIEDCKNKKRVICQVCCLKYFYLLATAHTLIQRDLPAQCKSVKCPVLDSKQEVLLFFSNQDRLKLFSFFETLESIIGGRVFDKYVVKKKTNIQ